MNPPSGMTWLDLPRAGQEEGGAGLPEPESWSDVKGELLLIRAELAAMRRELVRTRLFNEATPPATTTRGTRPRDEAIVALAAEIGLGRTWPAARRIAALWAGEEHADEPEVARLVEALQAWPALSQRQVWRVLSDS